MFSFPCFLNGLPGDIADLCKMLSSLFPEALPKYESSTANELALPGDNGVPRPLLDGLPRVNGVMVGVIFIEFSKATGRSIAPGGFRLLPGLPCGVDTGVMKLFRLGVPGRSLKGSFWLERV